MLGKKPGMRVVDLFCGGGGFSEGFHMAGFDVVYGADVWKPACDTHTQNGLGLTDRLDLLPFEPEDVLLLKKRLDRRFGKIDVLIGSPPCTEFSYAKNGGKGDLEKGMLLVRKHLLFVALFRPTYWLMENVPRLNDVMARECEGSMDTGWQVSYEDLGITHSESKKLGLSGDCLTIPNGTVLNAADFGTCENRRRFIVGRYPLDMVLSQKLEKDERANLGDLIAKLNRGLEDVKGTGKIEDPNYPGHFVKLKDVIDHRYDTSVHPMHWEEMRHLKTRHIQYGKMRFPDNLHRPARTVMGTLGKSSRETILFDTGDIRPYQGRNRPVYRRATVREVACIQGFPLDFQLVANSVSDRYRLVGNAVPCQLSYAIARAIRDDSSENAKRSPQSDTARRTRVTIARARRSRGPIITRPTSIMKEANGFEKKIATFGAKVNKHVRRKLLSSKLDNNSAMVIFENSETLDGRTVGGTVWKACLQKGIGSRFHRVYFDSVSVRSLVGVMRSRASSAGVLKMTSKVISDCDMGLPVLPEDWTEFPGYSYQEKGRNEITSKGRLMIPDVTLLQQAFTTDVPDMGGFVGPLDFFDALDFIMLRAFAQKQFRNIASQFIHVESLTDSRRYHGHPAMVAKIENTDLPALTIVAGFLSVHVLAKMYEQRSRKIDTFYSRTIEKANAHILHWMESQP